MSSVLPPYVELLALRWRRQLLQPELREVMLLVVHVLGIPRGRAVHTPTLVSKPAWVVSLRPALIGLGLRGRALEKIETQPLPADDPVDAVGAFTATLTQLERVGVGPAAVAGMLSRQPKLLSSLLTHEPAETLRGESGTARHGCEPAEHPGSHSNPDLNPDPEPDPNPNADSHGGARSARAAPSARAAGQP